MFSIVHILLASSPCAHPKILLSEVFPWIQDSLNLSCANTHDELTSCHVMLLFSDLIRRLQRRYGMNRVKIRVVIQEEISRGLVRKEIGTSGPGQCQGLISRQIPEQPGLSLNIADEGRTVPWSQLAQARYATSEHTDDTCTEAGLWANKRALGTASGWSIGHRQHRVYLG